MHLTVNISNKLKTISNQPQDFCGVTNIKFYWKLALGQCYGENMISDISKEANRIMINKC